MNEAPGHDDGRQRPRDKEERLRHHGRIIGLRLQEDAAAEASLGRGGQVRLGNVRIIAAGCNLKLCVVERLLLLQHGQL